jgi:hypothetical protein
VELSDEYRHIRSEMKIEPVSYIPSSADEETIQWLFYFYFINARTGRVFGISPSLERAGRKIYRWANGRHLFVVKPNPSFAALFFLLAGLADSILHPKKILSYARMLASGGGEARFHYIAIQTPPRVDDERKRINLCYHCPDATIRNGRLTPVCIADFLSPLDGSKSEYAREGLSEAVYSHLGEL